MPKISVIVPVYGVEKYIVKCLNSIVNQTFKDIEIIVINDGTKDNSIKLIEDNFNDKRIKIINKENQGAAIARNLGIEKAKGEYLFFVDSDDFIELETLEKMYDEVITKNCDLVICDYYKYFENGEKTHIPIVPFYNENDQKSVTIAMPGPVCKLIKKDIFDNYKLKFLENKIFEDNAIMPFVCAIAKKISYIQKPYYFYLQREGSYLNRKDYNKKWEDIFYSLDFMFKLFEQNGIIDMFYAEVEYIYIEYLLHAANLRFIRYEEAYSNIIRVSKVIKNKFPKWRNNKYYKKCNIKYKIICNLFYYKCIKMCKILLRIK